MGDMGVSRWQKGRKEEEAEERKRSRSRCTAGREAEKHMVCQEENGKKM